jgi:hypothetical protein
MRRIDSAPDTEGEELVVFWRMRKEEGLAEAVVWSHPRGAELRILADRHFVRSRIFDDLDALVEYATSEYDRLVRRGWVPAP